MRVSDPEPAGGRRSLSGDFSEGRGAGAQNRAGKESQKFSVVGDTAYLEKPETKIWMETADCRYAVHGG